MALKFRRGTTAQQSGSLAFGEPYVNTTLGTLLIGGPDGDIVLSSTGTGSTGNFGAISGSGLDITGNANIAGNLTLGGTITIGDNNSDNVVINADLSSSLIPNDDNAFDIGSTSKRYRNIYGNQLLIQSGSNPQIRLINDTTGIEYHIQNGNGGNFQIHREAEGVKVNLFLFESSSVAEGNQNAYFYSNVFVSESLHAASVFTSQVAANSLTGSLTGSITGIGNVSSYSSSVNSRLVVTEAVSASAAAALNSFSASNATIETTQDTNITAVFASASAYSASTAVVDAAQDVLIASLRTNVVSSSVFTTFSTSVDSRLDTVELLSASAATAYAKVGSANTFNGNQTITGSLFISQDLIVQGSSSIQNISSSTLNIGTNLITVNTLNPGTRFGGLAVIDSGSSPLISGSILFDSINDQWIFVHQIVSGAATTSSVFLMGPQTYNSLGSEAYPTTNRVVKSINSEHIGDSNITDNGTLITLGSNTSVTGTLVATGTSLVSASAQIDITSTTGYSTFSSSVASTISNLGSTYATDAELSSVSSAVATTISNLGSTYATDAELSAVSSAIATRDNGQDTTISTLSSSVASRLGTLETKDITITLTGDVTGTGTITDLGNVSFATTVAANSVALGTDTTGDYVSSLVAGTNITLSNNSGEGATPTIGLTNNTISGIALGSNLATLTIGTGLSGTSYNGSTGVTIANTGVTSNVAGTGVTVSGATGAVTISIGQAVATSDNVRFNSLGIGMAASATAGRIDASNDIVAFSSSDIRFKENITPIENALEKISKISGNTYDWKEENKAEHGYEGNDVGVIAQEIEAVLPQLVQTRESGYKAVKYDKLVALLIEGIKEQQTQIHSLTLEIEKLKESKGL